jgi:hypothetical protein
MYVDMILKHTPCLRYMCMLYFVIIINIKCINKKKYEKMRKKHGLTASYCEKLNASNIGHIAPKQEI